MKIRKPKNQHAYKKTTKKSLQTCYKTQQL